MFFGTIEDVSYSGWDLAGLVARTLDALKATDLPLETPGSLELAESRRQLIAQLETRILPRLASSRLPTVVVFGGSSGAGKSTLVNSLVGAEISPASVIRPTTRTPLILVHPDDAPQMAGHPLAQMGKFVEDARALPGLVIVDAPDLDSVEQTNRELSARLIDAADLWVFVTTASRYGDALAWDTLVNANERGVTCGVVLDRVPDHALATVRSDLTKRLVQMGMDDLPLFVVHDAGPATQLLPAEYIGELRQWLTVVSRTAAGDSLVERTTQATLPQLRQDLLNLAQAVEAQSYALVDLRDKAAEGAQQPISKLITNIEHGRFGQGAPTTAWLSLASTGGPLASLFSGRKPLPFRGRRAARDRAITTVFDSVLASVEVALAQGLTTAQENIDRAWAADVVNTAALIERAHARIDQRAIVERALAGWKADIAGLRLLVDAWLGKPGQASLVGTAAAGINGALKVAERIGTEQQVRDARHALVARVREALGDLVSAYTGVIGEIEVGDAATLRLRAGELANR